MASTSPAITQYNELLSKHEFVFAVYYRGHWCPFCLSYLETLQSLSPAIKEAGGAPVVITSEVEEHLAATRKSSGYQGEAIVDVKNTLAADLKKKEILQVAISEKSGYAHGMAQPSLLVQKRDGSVLESWAIVPGAMNMGGAKDRPDLNQVWDNVKSQLAGGDIQHSKYKKTGVLALLSKMLFS